MPVTVEQIRALGAPFRPYLFSVFIDPRGVGNVLGDRLSFLCNGVSFPSRRLAQAEVNLSSFTVRYAGRLEFEGSFSVTLHELTTYEVVSHLYRWMELCFQVRTGVQALPDEYKSDASIFLLNDSRVPVKKFKVIGLWPMEMPNIELRSENSEAVMYDVTFSFDYWEDLP